MKTIPNPDLLVGEGNKQRWNQPAHRRHGFHNAYRIFRRSLTLRAPCQLVLKEAPDLALAALPATQTLLQRPEISALVCARGGDILLSHYAQDFPEDQPHSIQSISKLFMHLIAGRMIGDGLLDPARPVEHYLPDIGSGYRGATVQMVLDMDVKNDFSEDYMDPNAACFDEEIALGWRLPRDDQAEMTLTGLVNSITSTDVINHEPTINYRSANTDLLTVLCDRLVPGQLAQLTEDIVAAAGFEHALHISLSREGLPTFSGGGCLTARDLARFGLLLARQSPATPGTVFCDPDFTRATLARPAKTLPPPRDHVRYCNQAMTDGRWLGHAGYGGQFLMVDMQTGVACAFLSVLENEAGYCLDYMAETVRCLQKVIHTAGHD